MCTVVLLIRPDHDWPLILVANRDEQVDRTWAAPAAHWPDRPGVIGGRDLTAGGTWMSLNNGLTAAVLNRPGSLGPLAGKRSRGDLPLMAVSHPSATAAAEAMTRENAGEWRGFNLVIADRAGAWFVRGAGHGHPAAIPLKPGVSMITAHDPNDPGSPRVARHLDRFRAAAAPTPDNWDAWRAILADRSGDAGEQINVEPRGGFGTVCSSFLAIPRQGDPVWLFAAGAPDRAPFHPVTAESAASLP
jgi:Transport and Golgi organisation 2